MNVDIYTCLGVLCFLAVIYYCIRYVVRFIKDNDENRNTKDIEELRNFKKPGWTGKKKVIAIISIPFAVAFAALGAYLLFNGITQKHWLNFCFGTCSVSAACYVVITFVLPKRDKSLEAVKDFLTMSEVENLIKNETFKLVEYPELIRSEGGIWSVYESKHWLSVRGVLIPKNFVIGFELGEELREDNIRVHGFNFFCLDGSQWFAGHMEADQRVPAKKKMEEILPQLKHPRINEVCRFKDIFFIVDYRKEIETWYKNTMTSKEDFIHMIDTFDYSQLPEHKPLEFEVIK